MNLEIPDISLSWAGAHVLRTRGDWGEIDLMGGASFRSLYDWGKVVPLGVVILPPLSVRLLKQTSF